MEVFNVALRKESVDRNPGIFMVFYADCVALRKESVDRNENNASNRASSQRVALRKESVDRNVVFHIFAQLSRWSLSARRAWIEIFLRVVQLNYKEGRSPQGERG